MLNKTIVNLVGAIALTLGLAGPIMAQTAPGTQTESEKASGTISGERVLPGRIGSDRTVRGQQRERRQRDQQPAAAAPTPEEIRANAQAQLTAASVTCELTEAVNPGKVGEADVFEVACANGPGYILMATTPPQAFDCIELAGTAAIARAADPAADVGQQCALPANQNGLQVMTAWAQGAGAACTIDQAQAIGKNDGNMVYEIGCANADGYWLEKAASAFTLTPCVKVTSQGGTCRFTTPEEIATSFQARLAGTDAANCQVTQVRLMGGNANGEFYEAKCATEGEGFIARIDAQGATQQVYPCATAQRIGGGCTLTTVAATAAAPATGGRP